MTQQFAALVDPVAYVGEMLADEYAGWPDGVGALAAEHKYDGYRLSAMVGDSDVHFYCRDAAQPVWAQNLDHVRAAILQMGFRRCLLDGEVMAATWGQLGIVRSGCSTRAGMSTYTRPSDDVMARICSEVSFRVFDYVDFEACARQPELLDCRPVGPRGRKPVWHYLVTYRERRRQLEKLVPLAAYGMTVGRGTWQLVGPADVQRVMDFARMEGDEGLMLKGVDSFYVFSRTSDWVKVKPTRTVDLQVVDVVEGKGKQRGMMGALHCRRVDGQSVSVGTGFSDQARRDVWERHQRGEVVGSFLEITEQDCDVATSRHPSFSRWRPERTSF